MGGPVAVQAGVQKTNKPFAVKLSYTTLGQCAAAVIRRWDA